MGKEVFLRCPPPPFDHGFERGERRRSDDTDEDWLPDITDIFSGNVHVLIDMTGDSDSENDVKSSFKHPRTEPEADLATAYPARSHLSLYGQRPLWAGKPPKAVACLDFEQAEIPESPGATQDRPDVSVPSRDHSDGDSGGNVAMITTAVEAIAGYTEQNSNVDEQQDHTQNHITTPHLSSTREAPRSERASYISIQDLSFLRIEGQREAAGGLEYQLVTKMWLQPCAGIPSDLLHTYRMNVSRQARLATLRTRKRMSEEAGVVKVKRSAARTKVRQAQV